MNPVLFFVTLSQLVQGLLTSYQSALIIQESIKPNQMHLSVRCSSAPWENTTEDKDRAIDIAYSLSEEYSCDVQLVYTSTGTIHSVVSNY